MICHSCRQQRHGECEDREDALIRKAEGLSGGAYCDCGHVIPVPGEYVTSREDC